MLEDFTQPKIIEYIRGPKAEKLPPEPLEGGRSLLEDAHVVYRLIRLPEPHRGSKLENLPPPTTSWQWTTLKKPCWDVEILASSNGKFYTTAELLAQLDYDRAMKVVSG